MFLHGIAAAQMAWGGALFMLHAQPKPQSSPAIFPSLPTITQNCSKRLLRLQHPLKPCLLHCTRHHNDPDAHSDPPGTSSSPRNAGFFQAFSRLPDVSWDWGSLTTTMISYYSILHIPLGLGGLSILAELLHVKELDSQTKATSLVFFQLLELGGASWLIQSSLKESKSSLQCFNFNFEDLGGSRGWLVTSTFGLAIILLVMAATPDINGIHPNTEVDGKVEALKNLLSVSVISQFSTFLVCCGLTPCLEEIVYRGYLLQSLTARFQWHSAAVISALLFAVGHFDFSGAPVLFFIGCILGIAYTWSGNLASSFLIHSAYNTVILLSKMLTD